MPKAAEAAAAEGVPLVSLAIGTPEGPRNAAITKIDVSPVVFVRDPNQAHVLVDSRGMAGQPATVVLEKQAEGGAVGGNRPQVDRAGRVGHGADRRRSTSRKSGPPSSCCGRRFNDVGPELTTADNVQLAEVRAIRQKIKVLFVSGHPFPEFEFIRNMLLRDNALSAAIWLQTADKDYDQPGTPPIKRLPITQEELNDFDCVILYDPDPALWPEQFPQLLTDFVGKAGGGMIYVAGERFTKDYFDRPDDPNSAWLPLLPVVSEPGLFRTDVTAQLSAKNAWKLEITPEGHADPVFQFADRPEENDRILAALPGMFWHYPVTRAKAGATVLARHADPRMRNEYGNHVLLATQLVGPGRTFFVGFDSTYRWRYLDEQTFDGFWARMIDRAGRSKQLGGRYPFSLSTDRASYRPGSQVTLTARFENPNDKDAGLEQIARRSRAARRLRRCRITLNAAQRRTAAFEASFPSTRPGRISSKSGRATPTRSNWCAPRRSNFRWSCRTSNTTSRRSIGRCCEALAKPTGGAVFTLADIDRMPDAFQVRRVAHVLEDRQPIFNAPILFGGFCFSCSWNGFCERRCG